MHISDVVSAASSLAQMLFSYEGPYGAVNIYKLISYVIDNGTRSQGQTSRSILKVQPPPPPFFPKLGPKCAPWQSARSAPRLSSCKQKLHLEMHPETGD